MNQDRNGKSKIKSPDFICNRFRVDGKWDRKPCEEKNIARQSKSGVRSSAFLPPPTKIAWNWLKSLKKGPSKLPKIIVWKGPNSFHKKGWVFAHLRRRRWARPERCPFMLVLKDIWEGFAKQTITCKALGRAAMYTMLFKIITRMKVLCWNSLGDCSYCFSGVFRMNIHYSYSPLVLPTRLHDRK